MGRRRGQLRSTRVRRRLSVDDIIREFLIECNELLDQMDAALIGLEKDPDSRDLLNQVFRTVHTIKGTSGSLGYPHLQKVSHSAENLLSLLRKGQTDLTAEMATALLGVIDVLRRLLVEVEVSGTEGNPDTSLIFSALDAFVSDSCRQGSLAAIEVDTSIEPNLPVSVANCAAADAAIPAPKDKNAVRTGLNVSASTIRVDVNLLDKLMDLVGELVLARNQLLQTAARINDTPLARTAVRLKALTSELQEGITKTRMQPIENVWKKLPRMVRDVSAACGKSVRLEMQGAETELDKTLLEAINDPLIHIIRNSIDHGIEDPAERVERGKPQEGHILLRAFHEGGQVNIELSDDGRGISVERVKQKAIQEGSITAAQAAVMSDQEGINLIFLPGISTASQVTSVSGRGVGMDVVKTNIEKIGGTVDLVSELGSGTKLTIKIPLTLAIISALIVSSCQERFAIPQASLVELVRLDDEAAQRQIERIHGQPVY